MGKGSGIGTGAAVAPYDGFSCNESVSSHRSNRSLTQIKKCDKLPPPVGLINVGNSCYANAALQCLLSTALSYVLLDPTSTHIFRRYSSNPHILLQGSGSVDSNEDSPERQLDSKSKRREARRKAREKLKMQETCQWLTGELTNITRLYTAGHYVQDDTTNWKLFMDAIKGPEQKVVDPGAITRKVNRLSSCLRPYQQEDAHEFMRSLLSNLTLDGYNKELSSLFDGLLESTVTCQSCRCASVTRDRYMDISLDIPNDVTDLLGALQKFTETELLDSDNKVDCSKCLTKTVVSKGLRLATAPSVLVCHLKRFSFDMYGRTTRLNNFVKYPLQLEIADFMSRANQGKPPPYELVGVLVHAGRSCDRGHYYAFVKCGNEWYKTNDETITKVDVDTALNQQAYILMYEVEGMRVRNGFYGFKKYHKQEKLCDSSTVTSCRSESQRGKNVEEKSVLSLLDSMLNLCGSPGDALDRLCDSDREKLDKKKMKRSGDNYIKVATTICSASTTSCESDSIPKYPELSRRSRSRSVNSIMKTPTRKQEYSNTDAYLSGDPHFIANASNILFEMEEEAATDHERDMLYAKRRRSNRLSSSRSLSTSRRLSYDRVSRGRSSHDSSSHDSINQPVLSGDDHSHHRSRKCRSTPRSVRTSPRNDHGLPPLHK